MYQLHFNLKELPFQANPDPKFLWLGEKHKEAFSILKYGTIQDYGFVLLTGDVGTGKTTLVNALINSLGHDIIAASVPYPNLDILEFLNFITYRFGSTERFDSKLDFLIYFKNFLQRCNKNNKKVLLIIDEAHNMSAELLEEVRLLSNIEKQDVKLLNIFFVGQSEIKGIFSQKSCKALRQRITLTYDIDALDERETADYITNRLRIAGSEKDIFTKKYNKVSKKK